MTGVYRSPPRIQQKRKFFYSLPTAAPQQKTQTVEGVLSFAGTITRSSNIVKSGVASFTGTTVKLSSKTYSGVLSFSSTATKLTYRSLSGVFSSIGELINQLLKKLRPATDDSIGQWTDENNGTTNIYNSINETFADDNDYIKSDSNPSSSVYRLKIGDGTDPIVHTNHKVRYRYKKNSASGTMNLVVRLVCGVTTIATWTHNDIDTTWVTAEQALTEVQAENITDYTTLYLEFEATKV